MSNGVGGGVLEAVACVDLPPVTGVGVDVVVDFSLSLEFSMFTKLVTFSW